MPIRRHPLSRPITCFHNIRFRSRFVFFILFLVFHNFSGTFIFYKNELLRYGISVSFIISCTLLHFIYKMTQKWKNVSINRVHHRNEITRG